MSASLTKVLIAAGCFALVVLSGFVLRGSEKPYNTLVFTAHKLITVGVLVFLAVTVYRTYQDGDLGALALAVSVLTGLLFIGTIITGGALSIERSVAPIFSTLHQILPFGTILGAAATLYLVVIRAS